MAQTPIQLIKNAIAANRCDHFRRGNIIELPSVGDLIITGDLHGNRRNFHKIQYYAALDKNPNRHIIFQEIIHGGSEDSDGNCLSYQLLFDLYEYKLQYPNHVHILTGNHDMTFVNDTEVLKNGRKMNQSLKKALSNEYGAETEAVINLMKDLFLSQPLAMRSENKLWCCHSLPSGRFLDNFDPAIMQKDLTSCDFKKTGPVYSLLWGRNIAESTLANFSELFTVESFVLGHQNQPDGWSRPQKNLIILASEHNFGCLLKTDLASAISTDSLVEHIVSIASIDDSK